MKTLREQHVRPEARWKVLFRRESHWVPVLVFGAIVIAAVTVVSAIVADFDWEAYVERIHRSPFLSVFDLPYLWVLSIAVFLVGIVWAVRNTDTGYRWRKRKILSFGILVAILGGALLAGLHTGSYLHEAAERHIPFYKESVVTKEAQWSRPAEGFLGGTIETMDENGLALRDFSDQEWSVHMDAETKFRPPVILEPMIAIKIVGDVTGDHAFFAHEIRSWDSGNQRKAVFPPSSDGSSDNQHPIFHGADH